MFKDNHFILIVFIMSDIYDRKKLYEKNYGSTNRKRRILPV